jgi:hypothetical protein
MTRRPALPSDFNSKLAALTLMFGAVLACTTGAQADDAPGSASAHQLMKECMAKQKASESGKTRADMRKACKDVTKNEKQNDERAVGDPPAAPQK